MRDQRQEVIYYRYPLVLSLMLNMRWRVGESLVTKTTPATHEIMERLRYGGLDSTYRSTGTAVRSSCYHP
jgi:hypothetical protein